MAATLIKRTAELLSNCFKGSKVHLKYYRPGSDFGGVLVWEAFDGLPQIDRQVKLRKVINEKFKPEEAGHVSFIMTLTPHEEAVLAEGDKLAV